MEQHVARPEARESRSASLRILAALLPAAPFCWMLWEIAIKPPPEDLSYRHVWAMLPTFYFLGLVLARRRNR